MVTEISEGGEGEGSREVGKTSTYFDVVQQTGALAGLSHVRVEAVPGRPVIHPTARYDHDVFDTKMDVLRIQWPQAAVTLVDEHDHTASRTE